MDLPSAQRHYSNEEKSQLIANLNIEVEHRTRQFEAWLKDRLENFTIHQEGQVSRIPKQVRGMTMREFGTKYEGNIQSALRGYQKERLVAAGGDATLGEIDKSMRKRKWVASQEAEAELSESSQPKDFDSQRALKNARTQLFSPKKVAGSSTGPGTPLQSRLLPPRIKTPSTLRTEGDRILKRTKSGITIRRDPSAATMNGFHSRTNSQTSFYTASSQATSSSSSLSGESSFNSHSQNSQTNFSGFRFPAPPTPNNQTTPRPAFPHLRSFSALVAIPTKDGHLLEFDPLQTSPGALNALEGITDSAKKQARVEMGRLVQAAVDKWKIR